MAKSTSRPGRAVAPKIKTSVSLSPESFKKLSIAVALESKSQSELVEDMILRLLSGYSASVRGAGLYAAQASPSTGITSASMDHEVSSPMQISA